MSCTYCYKGFALPGEPKGTMVGQDYFTAAPKDDTEQTKAIVLLTDVFGLHLPNPRIIADHLAKQVGVDVWVPDLFNGASHITSIYSAFGGWLILKPWTLLRSGKPIVKLIFNFIPTIPRLIASSPSVVDRRVNEFIKKIKSEKGYERIGAIGLDLTNALSTTPANAFLARYGYGGVVTGRLGSTGFVDTIVMAHPRGLTQGQILAIKVPSSWALTEEDHYFKNKVVQVALLKEEEEKPDHDYEVTVYKGTAHGFAVRPNLKVPEVKVAYEGALDQTVTWFKKTL
ncbi:dienelactone hydrolase endo-1-3,1,4-beta-D-glucanase [Russula emetica]|nr:dienelactone hydrolase endo-1-3,1,4-beta-D-glucanase [Russula emetica]